MGISPGKGEHGSRTYPRPTVAKVHNGFGGKLSDWDQDEKSRFWRRIRKLATGIVEGADRRMKGEERCLAVCGELNLGIYNHGRGGINATDPEIIRWIPDAVEALKPKVVVLLGWQSLRIYLRKYWPQAGFPGQVVHKDPDKTYELKVKSEHRYHFRIWDKIATAWGDVVVIQWPNHPSQHPFGSEENWAKSIKQAVSFLKKIN